MSGIVAPAHAGVAGSAGLEAGVRVGIRGRAAGVAGIALLLAACAGAGDGRDGGGDPGQDAGADLFAGPDDGIDEAVDEAVDETVDGTSDATGDALADAATDAATEATGDATEDLPADPGLAPVREPASLDDFLGIADLPVANGTGFFRPALLGDRWVLATPSDHAFLSLGVTTLDIAGDVGRGMDYASYTLTNRAAWGEGDAARTAFHDEALRDLRAAGFTTVGGWSGDAAARIAARKVPPLPYTVSLGFAARQTAANGTRNVAAVNADGFPDVFDPDFAGNCQRHATAATAPFRKDPFLIGYFLDNELKWWGEGALFHSPGVSLADGFLALAPGTPGKEAWVAFLQSERGYADVTALDAAWGTTLLTWEGVASLAALADDPEHPRRAEDKAAFLFPVARAYLEAADAALRAADPDHLDLCVRFATSAPLEVVRAMAPCDVLTLNDYYTNDDDLTPDLFLGSPEERWAAYALAAGGGTTPKPTLLTEFGLRAMDSGLPNGMGAGFVGGSQAERGAYYRDVLDRLLGLRAGGRHFVVGFHWFEWRDEPKTGRWDGEDGNYGLVAVDGSPYRPLWHALASCHARAVDRLLGGTAPMLAAPSVRPGQDEGGWPVLAWDPVPGAAGYEVHLAPAPWLPAEVSPSPLQGLLEAAPADLLYGTGGTSLALPFGLPAGAWWADVSAVHGGRAFPSLRSAPVALAAPRACTAGDGGGGPGCFTNHAPGASHATDGWARAAAVRRQGRGWMSLRFVANTLATTHPRNGGAGSELVLAWEPPAPLAAGAVLPGFCAGIVVRGDGTRVPASRFLRLRLRGTDGAVLSDGPLDPGGAVAAGACADGRVEAPGAVMKVEWVLPTGDPDLPLDVPVEVLAGPF